MLSSISDKSRRNGMPVFGHVNILSTMCAGETVSNWPQTSGPSDTLQMSRESPRKMSVSTNEVHMLQCSGVLCTREDASCG